MEEVLHYTLLYDLYKGLLTSKQRETFKDYFEENLTIEEIADNNGISKSAVSKTIIGIKEFETEEDILIRLAKYDNIVS